MRSGVHSSVVRLSVVRLSGVRLSAVLAALLVITPAVAEDPASWYRNGQAYVERAKKITPITSKAKNVILFIGDGMGVSTVTAARIFEGQQRGLAGEENVLSFETLPYSALVKTYSVNQQTPESAATGTAILTGVKTCEDLLSVNQNVTRGDHTKVAANKLTTILELAERAGLATGIVSTARVTHATPAACYAHSPDRNWEDDAMLPAAAAADGFPDIARQLIEFDVGDGPEVVLGGGRSRFVPITAADPEDPTKTGRRKDGRNLTNEWLARPGSVYAWNESQLGAVDVGKTRRLLGLFARSHLAYEHDRSVGATDDDPSLSTMTAKAIDMLSKSEKGFFLMVEGARIDHAHHGANAFRALTETIEFAKAVRVALDKTDRRETLLIVTVDHSHTLTLSGYATRGNPILGRVMHNDAHGKPTGVLAKDGTGLPYTALQYAMGPGYTGASESQPEGVKRYPHNGRGYKGITTGRPDLTSVDTSDPSYVFESAIPGSGAPHGGEDVPLFADGPFAHLFHGVLEQNVTFHVMVEALGLSASASPPSP